MRTHVIETRDSSLFYNYSTTRSSIHFFGGNLFVMANQLNCFQSCQISPPFNSQNPHKIISVLYENSQLHILLQIAQLKTFEEIWR